MPGRLEIVDSGCGLSWGGDSVFHVEESAQATREQWNEFLPGKYLAADTQFRVPYGSHYVEPGLAQIGTPLVVDHAEAGSGCVRCEDVANQLVACIARFPGLLRVGASFDF